MTAKHRRTPALLLLGWCAIFAAGAAQANDTPDKKDSCRQETKRVAVWPPGPKSAPIARFEKRAVTVCDAKVSHDDKTTPAA